MGERWERGRRDTRERRKEEQYPGFAGVLLFGGLWDLVEADKWEKRDVEGIVLSHFFLSKML
jgi:hypothetical protein